jgi:hypothetical protein
MSRVSFQPAPICTDQVLRQLTAPQLKDVLRFNVLMLQRFNVERGLSRAATVLP